jgi:hypothetical protein
LRVLVVIRDGADSISGQGIPQALGLGPGQGLGPGLRVGAAECESRSQQARPRVLSCTATAEELRVLLVRSALCTDERAAASASAVSDYDSDVAKSASRFPSPACSADVDVDVNAAALTRMRDYFAA